MCQAIRRLLKNRAGEVCCGLLGLLAGYYRGWIDVLLMRFTDIVLSFPIIILYIIIITTYGPSAINIIISVTFTAAPQVIRIVRGHLPRRSSEEEGRRSVEISTGRCLYLLKWLPISCSTG